jgi:phage-related protein
MRPITRRTLSILNSDMAEPIVLLDLKLVGATDASTIRLTNAGEALNWNGNDYTPFPFNHSDVRELLATDGGSVPSVDVSASNVDLQMAGLLSAHELNGASAVLRVTDRKRVSLARDAITITRGEVRNPTLDGQALGFTIVNAVGMAEQITVPRRIFQKPCNYRYGSTACGATREQVATTAQSGSTDSIIILPEAAFAAAGVGDRTEYWAAGYLLFYSGDCTLQMRPIQKIDGTSVHLGFPLLATPAAGDDVLLRRGCRKTKADCTERQGNANNYGGYEGVPYGRITPVVRGNQ